MNSNHKSISSRTKKPVLGLILGARQMRLISYFSTLLLTQSPLHSRGVLLNRWSYGKITFTSCFFFKSIIIINLKHYFVAELYQEGIWYTMTFSHLQEMRRSTVTCLTEAKVHLSLTQDVKHMISTDLFAVSKLHVPWQVQTVRIILWAWAYSRWNKAKKNCAVVGWVEIPDSFWKSSILRPPGWRWL